MCIIDILLGTSFNALLMVLFGVSTNTGYVCFQNRLNNVCLLLTSCHIVNPSDCTIESINIKFWCLTSKIVKSSLTPWNYPSTSSASHENLGSTFCSCFLCEVMVYDKVYVAGKTCIYIVGLIAQALLVCTVQWAANTCLFLFVFCTLETGRAIAHGALSKMLPMWTSPDGFRATEISPSTYAQSLVFLIKVKLTDIVVQAYDFGDNGTMWWRRGSDIHRIFIYRPD